MEHEIRELNDVDLEKVSGGSHLSSDEVKSLKAGQKLVIEDCLFDLDVGLGEFTGNWRDPGTLSMLEVEVKVLEVYTEFRVSGKIVQVGDVIYVTRWVVDFPERA